MAAKKQAIEKLVNSESITVLTQASRDVLAKYAMVLSQETLAPAVLAQTFQALRDIEKVLEDKSSGLTTIAKKRVIAYLKSSGRVTTEKGSMEAAVGGLTLSMHPSRTGFDPKKVEGLLRAKGKEPSGFMVAKVSYAMPEDDAVSMEKLRKVLGDELESCRYEESWTVNTPK